MRFALPAALFAVLVAPPVADATPPSLAARDVPLGSRTAASSSMRAPFDLVGLHWRGSGSVAFRTRSVAGRWSAWRPAAPEAEDAPGARSREAARTLGWRVGNPYWTGPSDRIEYRVRGRVTRLRAHFVRSPPAIVPARKVSIANSPPLLPRLSWRANERIRRGRPIYASSLRFAVVHHTAGTNTYSPAQAPAIVRAIQLYHVRGNGWNDIGYNFLVDKYGRVYEGRSGGVERNVVGAHAQGFNTGSVGVAVLGTYERGGISRAAQAAVARLLAWRLDLAHVDPLGTLTYGSGGNPRFPTGAPVLLRAVSGHRDTGYTSCPGRALYARLGAIARSAMQIGLPKLFAPLVRGAVGKRVRFTARLSSPLPWAVTVADATGVVVAAGQGTSAAVDWTWDATLARPGRYSYVVAAGPTVRPATGFVGGRPPPLALTDAAVVPPVISPNGDGVDDVATVSFTLSVPATVTATLADAAGLPIGQLFSDFKPSGRQSFVFVADALADGEYLILLEARTAGGAAATATVQVVVSRA